MAATGFPEDDFEALSDQGAVDAVATTCPAADFEIGMFFDGTNNNLANTEEGNQLRAAGEGNHDQASYNNDLSNVAKLFKEYRKARTEVPNDCGGVAIYRHSELIDGIGTTAGQDDRTAGFALGWGQTGVANRVGEGFLLFLRHLQAAKAKGEINKIKLDVFGFSRGAAAARHFVNCVHRGHANHGYGGPFYEVQEEDKPKIEIRFVGLFDTVVSWGLTANDTSHGPLMIGLRGDSATKIVHLTALDEMRENFPLTHAPDEAETIWMPGAHADIGGGYPDFWLDRVMIRPAQTVTPTFDARPNTPEEIAAFLAPNAEDAALLAEQVADGWLLPTDGAALTRDFTPVGTYSYNPYVVQHFMTRRWMNHRLSHVALHLMHDKARLAQVPLPATLPSDDDHNIPPGLTGLLADLRAGVVFNHATSKPFRRDWVHHSASWKTSFIFIPMKPREEKFRSVWPNDPSEAW